MWNADGDSHAKNPKDRTNCNSTVLPVVDTWINNSADKRDPVHKIYSPRPYRRNVSPIAQSRWPRWVIWRSSGAENGTELDAPAGPKRGVNVYVASMLSRTCGEATM